MFTTHCLQESTLPWTNDKIQLYSFKCCADLHLLTFNPIPTPVLSTRLPPELIQNILYYSAEPLIDAFSLSSVINGPLDYIIHMPEFYKFLTSSLNHYNFNYAPFSPFDFFLPPENSLAGVYFTTHPLWSADVNYLHYFTKIFNPVIEITYSFLNHRIKQPLANCTCYGCRNMQLIRQQDYITV